VTIASHSRQLFLTLAAGNDAIFFPEHRVLDGEQVVPVREFSGVDVGTPDVALQAPLL
jgi:hypothetical protein